MKIGIDIQASKGRKTGLGVYAESLTQNLALLSNHDHQFYLYGKEINGDWNTFERLWWENISLPRFVKKDRLDLLHVAAFAPPWLKRCRLVMTVHDLIGMIYPNQRGWPSK